MGKVLSVSYPVPVTGLVCLLFLWGYLLWERICSHGEFFLLEKTPFCKGFIVHGRKQKVVVVVLCPWQASMPWSCRDGQLT